MKLVWSEPSEAAIRRALYTGTYSPRILVAMSMRDILGCQLAESAKISREREINLDNYTEGQAMALIDLLSNNGCSPELV